MINIESGSPAGCCEWINSCFVQFNHETGSKVRLLFEFFKKEYLKRYSYVTFAILPGVCAYVRFCTTGAQYLFRWLGQQQVADKVNSKPKDGSII